MVGEFRFFPFVGGYETRPGLDDDSAVTTADQDFDADKLVDYFWQACSSSIFWHPDLIGEEETAPMPHASESQCRMAPTLERLVAVPPVGINLAAPYWQASRHLEV